MSDELEINHRGSILRTVGLASFSIGGGPDDALRVLNWTPGRLFFLRRQDGWAVFDRSDGVITVNGQAKSQWLVGSDQTIEGAGEAVVVRPVAGHRSPLPPVERVGTFGHAAQPVLASPVAVAPTRTLRIGRAPDNDYVVDDLRVAPYHADLTIDADGTVVLVHQAGGGLASYINGHKASRRQPVTPGDVVTISSHDLQVTSNPAAPLIELRGGEALDLVATGLAIDIRGTRIVRPVSFELRARQLLAVLGPSGSGKSTVVRALSGRLPPSEGQVLVGGDDLYGTNAILRQRIGYVPQDDVLHTTLTVSSALGYAAQLRLSDDHTADMRTARVGELLGQLGLIDRADTTVGNLSGGQRKRVNVATELITRPPVMFLDEPTSGLDPGYEKGVMLLLRQLADEGRTIVVVTHSLQSLEVCDAILVMAKGGQQAFYGPPVEALAYFGVDSLADIFITLDDDNTDFEAAWAQSRNRAADEQPPPLAQARRQRIPATLSALGQFKTLVRRYVEVLSRDHRQVGLTMAQGPILALLMLAVMGSGHLAPSAGPGASRAPQILLALILGAAYVGGSSSVREVVKENPILRQERAAGLGFVPYIASKALVLGVIVVLQSLILALVGTARQSISGPGIVFGDARFELFVITAMTGLASLGIGLLVSTVVSKEDKAMLILPVVLFGQFVLSGASFDVDQPVLEQVSVAVPAFWGYSAAASTVDIGALTNGCPDRVDGCPAAWAQGSVEWFGPMITLALLCAIYLAIATALLFIREQRNEL